MFDKGRATAMGKQGEYHYNCPLDQHLLNYLGIDPDALMAEIKAGKGDGELLEWVLANAKHNRAAWEIDEWSCFQDKRGPDGDTETLQFFAERVWVLSVRRAEISKDGSTFWIWMTTSPLAERPNSNDRVLLARRDVPSRKVGVGRNGHPT
jgi:hypothetical protein